MNKYVLFEDAPQNWYLVIVGDPNYNIVYIDGRYLEYNKYYLTWKELNINDLMKVKLYTEIHRTHMKLALESLVE